MKSLMCACVDFAVVVCLQELELSDVYTHNDFAVMCVCRSKYSLMCIHMCWLCSGGVFAGANTL